MCNLCRGEMQAHYPEILSCKTMLDKVDHFEQTFLIGNLLGRMEEGKLILCDLLPCWLTWDVSNIFAS